MSMNLRFPNITGATEAEQLLQIKSYLHQLVQQLNWAFTTLESGSSKANSGATESAMGDISAEFFYEMKSLLIQSSDTLNAYYEKINSRLEEYYLKKELFDTYVGATNRMFENLPNQYLSQSDFEAYKKVVTQGFDNLGNKYVLKTDYDAYQQQMSQSLTDLEGRMVLKTDFETYQQGITGTITGMQQQIDELGQRLDALSTTN